MWSRGGSVGCMWTSGVKFKRVNEIIFLSVDVVYLLDDEKGFIYCHTLKILEGYDRKGVIFQIMCIEASVVFSLYVLLDGSILLVLFESSFDGVASLANVQGV